MEVDHCILFPTSYSLASPEHHYQEPGVEAGDQGGDEPGQGLQPGGVDELAHLLATAGKQDEWNDGKAQLEREDDLAQKEQLLGTSLAGEGHHDDGWNDSEGTRDQAAQPGRKRDVDEALHDDLRSEEHTSELQSLRHLVCRLLLEKT